MTPAEPKMMRKANARRISLTQNGTIRDRTMSRAQPPRADCARKYAIG